jgi:hypothetical protein
LVDLRGGAVEIRPVRIDDLEVLIDIHLDTAIHHAPIDPVVFGVLARGDVARELDLARRKTVDRG